MLLFHSSDVKWTWAGKYSMDPRYGELTQDFILLEPLEFVVSDGLWQNQKWALLTFMDLAKTLKKKKVLTHKKAI